MRWLEAGLGMGVRSVSAEMDFRARAAHDWAREFEV